MFAQSSPSRRPQAKARSEPPAPWSEVLLGVLPFLFFGLAYLVQAAGELGWLGGGSAGLVMGAPLLAYGAVSTGLILSWMAGFPRSSLAYLGLGLFFGYTFSQAQVYGVRYGWQGWLPLLTGLVVGVLFSRTFVPLVELLLGFWNDWTRLSFVVYAFLLPMMTVVFFDSDWGAADFLSLIFDTLLLALGAAAYLRSRTALTRAASLQATMIVLLARGFWMSAWLGGPANLGSISLAGLAITLFFWGGLMFVPGLLDLLRRGLGLGNIEI